MADVTKIKDSVGNVYSIKDEQARADLLAKVDKTLTIVGITLENNITKQQLLTALGIPANAEANTIDEIAIGGVAKTIQNKIVNIVKSDIMNLIGSASTTNNGYMTKEDFTKLNTLYDTLVDSSSPSFVDTIQELLEIFEDYPEGVDIVQVLNSKQAKVMDATIDIDGTDETTVEGAISALAQAVEYQSNKISAFEGDFYDNIHYPGAKLVYDTIQAVISRVAVLEGEVKIQGVDGETLIFS